MSTDKPPETPHANSVPTGNEPNSHAAGEHWAWMIPGVLAIMACGVLAWMKMRYQHPDWYLPLVGLLIVATAALIRTLIVSYRKRNEPVTASPLALVGFFVGIFFGSLGKAFMIGLASSITFLASFFIAFNLGFIPVYTGGRSGDSVSPIVEFIIFGLTLGVAIWLLWKFLAKQ